MQKRKAAVVFILITLTLDMLGIGLVVPVLPKLVTALSGGTLSEGSATFGFFIACYALMQFLCAPVLGNLSDAYGRRPVILGSLFGAGLDYLLLAFAPTLGWLFVGRILAGITGANITAANAYIADVSAPEERAKNFGLIGACFGIGFILGPALGGLLSEYGVRAPFLAAAALNLCNAFYGLFVLPESHPPERRRPFDWQRVNPLASLRGLARVPAVLGLTAVVALGQLAHDVLPATWVLYTSYRFQWTGWQTGVSLATVGLCFAIVQGALTGRLVRQLGERRALLLGLTFNALGMLLYAFATQGWMLYAIIVGTCLGGIATPATMAMITRLVPASEQGAVQGGIASVRSVATIIGPLLAASLFGYFTAPNAPVHLPGAAFLAACGFLVCALLVAFVKAPHALPQTPSDNAAPLAS